MDARQVELQHDGVAIKANSIAAAKFETGAWAEACGAEIKVSAGIRGASPLMGGAEIYFSPEEAEHFAAAVVAAAARVRETRDPHAPPVSRSQSQAPEDQSEPQASRPVGPWEDRVQVASPALGASRSGSGRGPTNDA